eukprot:scaffold3610_cov57-Phaeocystis_antarctica.AAC.2
MNVGDSGRASRCGHNTWHIAHQLMREHTVEANSSPYAAAPRWSMSSSLSSRATEYRSTCSHLCNGRPGSAALKAGLACSHHWSSMSAELLAKGRKARRTSPMKTTSSSTTQTRLRTASAEIGGTLAGKEAPSSGHVCMCVCVRERGGGERERARWHAWVYHCRRRRAAAGVATRRAMARAHSKTVGLRRLCPSRACG